MAWVEVGNTRGWDGVCLGLGGSLGEDCEGVQGAETAGEEGTGEDGRSIKGAGREVSGF